MPDGEGRGLLAAAVASQASLSITQWGLGALGPQLADRYALSAAGLGALLSCGSIGNALALVPAGGVIDRVGPRRPLLWGGSAFGLALVAGSLAPNVLVLGAALAVSGLAGALVSIAGAVSIFHEFSGQRRGLALGVRQASVALGGLIAAVLLPGLGALQGPPLALFVSGVLAAACALVYGLVSPREAYVTDRSRTRFAPGAVLRTPGILRCVVIAMLFIGVLDTVLIFAVPALRADGASTAAASLLFAVISISAVVARLAWGRIADRQGGTRRRATLRDVGLVACGGALLYWGASAIGPAAAVPAMAVFAFGALGFNGIVYVLAGELAGPARAGQAVGLLSTVMFGGSALMAVPLGVLADAGGYEALWPAAAVLAALGVMVTLGLPVPARQPLARPR